MSLQTSLLQSVGVRGPLSESEATALDDAGWVLYECRPFSASLSKANQLVMNLGSFVTNKLQTLDALAVENVVNDVPSFYASYAAGVSNIVAQRVQANHGNDTLPTEVPHQLVALSYSQFCSIVTAHRDRLTAAGWTPTRIDTMEQEHKDLVRAIANEPALRSAVKACEVMCDLMTVGPL